MGKEKTLEERLAEIERKLDLIVDAFGLGKRPRMTPAQRDEYAKKAVDRWKARRALKTMELIDAQTGKMRCVICGYEHFKNQFKSNSSKKFHCLHKCTVPSERSRKELETIKPSW